MRSLKTTGALTRGSGMSDFRRAIWLLSKQISIEYGTKMEALINVLHATSEQHKMATPSRLKRDRQDFHKIQENPKEFSPYSFLIFFLILFSLEITNDKNYSINEKL